jgi:hypothetical protein
VPLRVLVFGLTGSYARMRARVNVKMPSTRRAIEPDDRDTQLVSVLQSSARLSAVLIKNAAGECKRLIQGCVSLTRNRLCTGSALVSAHRADRREASPRLRTKLKSRTEFVSTFSPESMLGCKGSVPSASTTSGRDRSPSAVPVFASSCSLGIDGIGRRS